ncbi:MAG: lipopolysaccharide biosynthesis protein [Hyphomicrobium aestuarii]|nr:lipopolysaccharide biosynthesis protein [Hyphomicrobium aestuarii]
MSAAQLKADGALAGSAIAGVPATEARIDRGFARRDAVSAFAIRCASAALLYITQVALARWMGANEYGVYVSVWTAIMIVGGMATLGLNLGVMRLVPVHQEGGDADGLRGLVVGSRAMAAGLGLVVALVGSLVLWLIPMSADHHAAAAIMLVCLPFYAISDMQDGLGRGHGWIAPGLVPPYIFRPILLIAGMAAAWVTGLEMTASTAATVIVWAVAAAAVLQAVWLHRLFTASHGAGPRRYAPRAWIASSLPLLGIAGAELALQNTDVMVLSRYAIPAEVAMYFAAAKTMALMMFVHYAVGSAMASRFAGLHERADAAGLQAVVRDAVRWTFWPSVVVAVAILAIGRPVLSLFGPGFADGYPIMAILVGGFLARSAMGPAEVLLSMMGKQRTCAVIMLAGAAVSLGLNLLLVPTYGVTGAAIATAIALATVGLLNGWIVERRLGLRVAIWRNAR